MSTTCSHCGDPLEGHRKDHAKRCLGNLAYSLRNANGAEQLFLVPLALRDDSTIVCACLCSHCVGTAEGWSGRTNRSVLKQHMVRAGSHWMGADPELVSRRLACATSGRCDVLGQVVGDRVPKLYWDGKEAVLAARAMHVAMNEDGTGGSQDGSSEHEDAHGGDEGACVLDDTGLDAVSVGVVSHSLADSEASDHPHTANDGGGEDADVEDSDVEMDSMSAEPLAEDARPVCVSRDVPDRVG